VDRTERHLRLKELWARLPAFRVIAEAQNLHRAAKRLDASPSTLSRTLKELEREIGAPLFERHGRALTLTEFGHDLLDGTRRAMDLVDETLGELNTDFVDGSFRVSSGGRLTMAYVLPALKRLRGRHPGLVPHVIGVPAADVPSQIVRGDIDAALVFEAQAHPNLEVELLGAATNGVYCGEGHPLHGKKSVSVDEVLRHRFAAPEPQDGIPALDGWPANIRRRVSLFASLLDPAIDACEDGELLAVLPDDLVRRLFRGTKIARVPVDIVPPTSIYGVRRATRSKRRSRAAVFLDEVRTELRQASR
jgi:DNA-binding transcriptional LysR family regulator